MVTDSEQKKLVTVKISQESNKTLGMFCILNCTTRYKVLERLIKEEIEPRLKEKLDSYRIE